MADGAGRILIVEDEGNFAAGLQKLLAREGYLAEVAASAAEARARIAEARPCLLLVDVLLPDEDGIGLCCGLHREGARFPALVMTGSRRHAQTLQLGPPEGVSGFLVKPFPFQELLERVRSLLGAHDPA